MPCQLLDDFSICDLWFNDHRKKDQDLSQISSAKSIVTCEKECESLG